MRVTVEHSFSFIGVYSRVQVGDHRFVDERITKLQSQN